MSRKALAAELQRILEQIQALAIHGEQLAGSTALVSASPFRAIQSAVSVAAGELDQKGLLDRKEVVPELPIGVRENAG